MKNLLVVACVLVSMFGCDSEKKKEYIEEEKKDDVEVIVEKVENQVKIDRANYAPLKINLPDPIMRETPTPIPGEPNIGPKRNGKRPPFLAPKGVTNVALNKIVTSSDPEPIIGTLQLVTDGENSGEDGYFVELAPDSQWIVIDLEESKTIFAIVVWHKYTNIIAYRDVIAQISQDKDFIVYKTVFNSDHDNSSGQGEGKDKGYMEDSLGKLIDCKGVTGRYVRLFSKESTSSDVNHYVEVEVYGK